MSLRRVLTRLLRGRSPGYVAQAGVKAVNDRRWDDFRKLASDDFRYRDSEDNELEGSEAFIAAMQAMLGDAPDFELDVKDYQAAGQTVVMKGFTNSENHRFRTVSAWRIDVKSGRILRWQNYRANDTVRLRDYAEAS